ncbi:hypothetical protein MtrunA17_Chr7g0251911 [Medicago truncatula]|uniref:Transmembrane protein n=1 Tax=Medicago truncatula TaxID=3880 RepID=A0A396H1W8_MEDTR|nr:hypothetical protein MtrunA17_Chr7g0251911 [Medicago truncatula]
MVDLDNSVNDTMANSEIVTVLRTNLGFVVVSIYSPTNSICNLEFRSLDKLVCVCIYVPFVFALFLVYDVDTGHDGGLRRKRIHNNSKPNLKSRHVPFYLSTFFLKDFIFQLLNREFIWFMPRFC